MKAVFKIKFITKSITSTVVLTWNLILIIQFSGSNKCSFYQNNENENENNNGAPPDTPDVSDESCSCGGNVSK